MKLKLIHYIILALFAISVFVSCASPDESSKIPADTQSPAATVEATEAQTEAPTETEIKTETAGETQALTEPQTKAVTEAPTEELIETESIIEESTESVTEKEPEVQTEASTEKPPIPDGSLATDTYTISKIDGQYYLNFADGNDAGTAPANPGLIQAIISYPSLSAMKQAITTNSFTESEIQIIKTVFPQDERGILVCNVNHLYEPVLPEGYTIGEVLWEGSQYKFLMKRNGLSGSGYIRILAKNIWDGVYQYELELLENKVIEQHDIGTFDGVPSETFVYTTGRSKLKKVILTIPNENASSPTMVVMHYCLEHYTDPDFPLSDTIPWLIDVYAERDGQYFKVSFQRPIAPPPWNGSPPLASPPTLKTPIK